MASPDDLFNFFADLRGIFLFFFNFLLLLLVDNMLCDSECLCGAVF